MLCIRCKAANPFAEAPRCWNCGIHKNRLVRKSRRSRPIGGKRGRNSGTTNTAKKKKA